MSRYEQRGNTAEAVRWTGSNIAEVEQFVLDHRTGWMKDIDPVMFEFISTMLGHLVIVLNDGIDKARVNQVIPRGHWVLDQGPCPESVLGVVVVSPERFAYLYKERGGE